MLHSFGKDGQFAAGKKSGRFSQAAFTGRDLVLK
jgi:hypothetical protein